MSVVKVNKKYQYQTKNIITIRSLKVTDSNKALINNYLLHLKK